ncbi:MAG: Gfo/Idh/MocA family oxidoreductase [Planctomycetes bacterium]|nr:Gfo/Idh/MocA family oxidoreductase [Planctomycetota bacterium]
MSKSRRSFLKSTLALTAIAASPRLSRAGGGPRIEDLRVGVIGIRSRGRNHISGFSAVPGVRVVAVSDCDTAFLDREKAEFAKQGAPLQVYRDYRELLASPAIDAVSIATPNHWHALMTIQAVQAGKHVYVEKPVSHSVLEGRRAVLAAQASGLVVQAGTQSRSNPGMRDLVAWIHGGGMGRVLSVRGLCYKRRPSIGRVEAAPAPPATVDLDLWCGPAPLAPPRRQQFHYDWHWDWDTGNGDLGNQGIHQVDIARWVLGESGLPRRVRSLGGRFGYLDDGETPNTQILRCDYERGPLWFEVRGLPKATGEKGMDALHGASVGVIVECEGGRVVIPSYTGGVAYDSEGKEIRRFRGGNDRFHYENFVQAVRDGRPGDLNGGLEEAHVSSAICHLGGISYRCGEDQALDRVREVTASDTDLTLALDRTIRHCDANGLASVSLPWRLGADLRLDPARETIVGSETACALLTRDYREGFGLPATVYRSRARR